MRETFTMEAAAKFYDPKTGEDIIHVIKESPISFLTSYVVPKTSPFVSKLNKLIIYSRECGIFERTSQNLKNYLQMRRVKRFIDFSSSGRVEEKKITLVHMKNVFLYYLVCVSVCCVAFLYEVLYAKLKHQWSFEGFVNIKLQRIRFLDSKLKWECVWLILTSRNLQFIT